MNWRAIGRRGLSILALAVLMAASVGVLYVSYRLAGLVATVVYALAFLFCFLFFPMYVGLLGGAAPLSGAVAKLHIILGQFAFGHGYLVQRDDKWEWCPGTDSHVYVDGAWWEIESGHENMSILGWRPFGILRWKHDTTYQDIRADTAADMDRTTTADGGSINRAGYQEAPEPAVTGIDGEWVIDLKRAISRGVKRIADIDVLETTEEIIERGEVRTSRTSYWGPILGSLAGLIIGVLTGYVFMVAG